MNCEKEREESRKKKESERIRYIEIEGKRERERERDIHVTPAATRRGAARRLASLKARAMGARGGSSREEAVSSQLPFYAAAVASARGLPYHAGLNYTRRDLYPGFTLFAFSLSVFPRLSPSVSLSPLYLFLSLFLLDQTAESDRQMNAVIRATG